MSGMYTVFAIESSQKTMKRHQAQGHYDREFDEHDAPTDPVMPILTSSPNAPTIADGYGMPAGYASYLEAIPTPAPYERPFPYQDVALPYPVYRPPETAVYPVLPPSPAGKNVNKRPPGGASSVYPVVPDRPVQTADVTRRRSLLPFLVGIFFVAVQLLLLVRFVLKLFVISGDTAWVAIVYTISSLFILPFNLLLQNIALPIPTAIELYTLLAILIYGLLSRILVHLLKAVLHSR
jgi:hypothetical protein